MLLPNYDTEPNVSRIAVLRANAIGDFVFSLPALEALRAAYPRAEIVLLGKPWHASLMSGRPGPIDRVITVPPARGVGESEEYEENRAEIEEFLACMRSERFDIAFQMHGGGRHSNPFVRGLGARLTVGFKTPDAEPLDRCIPYIYWQPEVLRYLELVAMVGARPVGLEPHLMVTREDVEESRLAVPETSAPLAVIHPGAGDPRRWWPTEKFAAVGDALARAGAHVVVSSGREEERPLVEAVAEAMTERPQLLWRSVSLGGLAGLLSRASVMVSNDSGPVHLAGAVGAPTVGIFWCGNLVNSAPVTRAWHRPVVSWRLNCPVCGTNTLESSCDHEVSFVADVPVDEVKTHALDLLSEARRQPQRQPARTALQYAQPQWYN